MVAPAGGSRNPRSHNILVLFVRLRREISRIPVLCVYVVVLRSLRPQASMHTRGSAPRATCCTCAPVVSI